MVVPLLSPTTHDLPQDDKPLNAVPAKNAHGMSVGPLALVDGYFLPTAPGTAAAQGKTAGVPLVIGSMAQETDTGVEVITANTTYVELEEYLSRRLANFSETLADELLQVYDGDNDGPYDVERLFTTIGSDIAESGPCDSLAKEMSVGYNGTIWRYIVTGHLEGTAHYWRSKPHWAFHKMDLWAAFSDYEWNEAFEGSRYEPTPNDYAFLARRLRRFLFDVIANGTHAGASYPTYNGDGKQMLFEGEGVLGVMEAGSYHAEARRLLYDAGVRPYGWRN